MTSPKIKILAGLQLVSAVLATIIGYFIVMPRFGEWGVVFTLLATSVALYWLGALLFKKEPRE